MKKLFFEKHEVKQGDRLTDFQGEEWRFVGMDRHKVLVKPVNTDVHAYARTFFVGVFPSCSIEEVTE